MIADTVAKLRALSTAPSDPEAFASWLEPRDAIAFLEDNARDDEFVVYAGLAHSYMHTVLVPASLVEPPDYDDLMSWSYNPTSSWGICQTFDPPSVSIAPPLDHTGSKTLDQGEQLVFSRYFEGRLGSKNYFEVLQRLTHPFGLHFLIEKNAYCRLDTRGDIEEVIRIIDIPEGAARLGGTIITFGRDLLDDYMALTDSVVSTG